MSYKQLAKKVLRMWIDNPNNTPLLSFVEQYCLKKKIKDIEKLKQFILFFCDQHTIKQIEKKFNVSSDQIVGIPPVCCRCGIMDPITTVKTDNGDTVYWVRPTKDGDIIHTTQNEQELSGHFVAILDKFFVWDGSYDIVCVDCAVEMYDEICDEDEPDEDSEPEW